MSDRSSALELHELVHLIGNSIAASGRGEVVDVDTVRPRGASLAEWRAAVDLAAHPRALGPRLRPSALA